MHSPSTLIITGHEMHIESQILKASEKIIYKKKMMKLMLLFYLDQSSGVVPMALSICAGCG